MYSDLSEEEINSESQENLLSYFEILREKNSLQTKNNQCITGEDDFDFPRAIPLRASTAPPRPLTEIEEFRRTSDFLLLENTVIISDHLK